MTGALGDTACRSAPELAPRAEPSGLLSGRARTQWTLDALSWALPLLIAALVASRAWDGPGWARALIVAAAIAIATGGAIAGPQLRWRRWRYDVRDEEVDLRHGMVTVVRTVVPMARIQHVEVRRTFLSQTLSTATLVLHTAAGAVEIPALDEHVAAALRDRIAELARTPDADDDR